MRVYYYVWAILFLVVSAVLVFMPNKRRDRSDQPGLQTVQTQAVCRLDLVVEKLRGQGYSNVTLVVEKSGHVFAAKITGPTNVVLSYWGTNWGTNLLAR